MDLGRSRNEDSLSKENLYEGGLKLSEKCLIRDMEGGLRKKNFSKSKIETILKSTLQINAHKTDFIYICCFGIKTFIFLSSCFAAESPSLIQDA